MKDKLDIQEFKFLVFEVVKLVPEGRATSYGAIAKAIGYPNMSRLVGKMMSGCSSLDIPAHRVVNSQGVLSGKLAFDTPTTMQEKLENENISIKNDRIRNWQQVFWDPSIELDFDK